LSTPIDLSDLDRLLADGAQLAEALPAEEYAEGHIPGAISLPLKELSRTSASDFAACRTTLVRPSWMMR